MVCCDKFCSFTFI